MTAAIINEAYSEIHVNFNEFVNKNIKENNNILIIHILNVVKEDLFNIRLFA